MLTSEQLNHYRSQGFIIVDNVILPSVLQAFNQVVLDVVTQLYKKEFNASEDINLARIDQAIIGLAQKNNNNIRYIQAIISRTNEFYQIIGSSKITALVRKLLELPEYSALYQTSNGVLVSVPSTATKKLYNWHNETFYTIPKSRFIQIWSPLLNAIDQSSGALVVCPGSHQLGIGRQLYDGANTHEPFLLDEKSIESYPQKIVEMKPGQVLLFNQYLAHQSSANVSDKVKFSLISTYHDISAPDFLPVSVGYNYLGMTPEEYYAEIFNKK